MLIESQIRLSVPGLSPEQLDDAIGQARKVMAETRDALNEHVALQEVISMNGHKIRYCVRGLLTHSEREYIYNLDTGELFAFQATYSHLDVDTVLFLSLSGRLEKDPGF